MFDLPYPFNRLPQNIGAETAGCSTTTSGKRDSQEKQAPAEQPRSVACRMVDNQRDVA